MCLPKKALNAEPRIMGNTSSPLKYHLLLGDWGSDPLSSHLKPFQSGTCLTRLQPTWPLACSKWEYCLVKALICSLAPQLLSVGEGQAPC